MAAFQEILDVLPARYRTLDVSNVQELRLRAGQSPAVVENGAERRLAGLVRQEELSEILQRATQQSAYACTQSLRQGFVTLPGGHRIGVCGSAVVKNGELAGYQALSSLCIRFARDVRMDSARLLPNLTDSCLILGAPGAGKTTLLRACIRALSESGQRVSVCDDRGEISAMTQGTAQFDLGPQTDILTGLSKDEGMLLLLRAMNPMWIAADEITARRDLAAMETISYCGVRLLATAHAKDERELRLRPLYRELLTLGMFRRMFVLLPDRQFRCVEVKTNDPNDWRCAGCALVRRGGLRLCTRGEAAMCAARRAFVGARYDAERNVGAAYSAGAAFLGAFRLPAEGCRGFFCGSRKGAVCAALLHGAGLLQTGLSAGEGLSPGRRECAGALRAFPEPRKVRSGIAACRNRTDEGKRHGGAVSPAGAEACAVQKL